MIDQSYSIMNRAKDFIYQNFLILSICFGLGIVGGVGYYFYDLYYTSVQERAQLAFAQALHEIRRSEKNGEMWPSAALAAKTGYRSYKRSSLAPYFLVLESLAALRQSNSKEAIQLLDQALREMGSSAPLYTIFKIKLALMKLDTDDVAVQNEGFTTLESLARDEKNKNRDEALYYLGDYYKNLDDVERATNTWQELIQKFSATVDAAASPWALLAQEKLHG